MMKKETKNSIRETFREYYEDVLTHIYGDKKRLTTFTLIRKMISECR